MKRLWLGIIAGAIAVAFIALAPTTNIDFWIIRATGRWIVENGRVPWSDPFAYSNGGIVWIEHKWLFDVLTYWLSLLGDFAPILFKVACVVTLFVAFVGRQSSAVARLAAALLFLVLLAACGDQISERPHLLADLLLVVFCGLLWRLEPQSLQRKNLRWLLPMAPLLGLQLLWSNIHGSFILGPMLVACSCFGWLLIETANKKKSFIATKYFAALMLGLLLMICLNPYGVRLLLSPWHHYTASLKGAQQLAEWQSLHWSAANIWLRGLLTFTGASLLLWITLLYRGRRNVTARDYATLLTVALFVYLGVSSQRFVLPTLLVLLPLAIGWWEKLPVLLKTKQRQTLQKTMVHAPTVLASLLLLACALEVRASFGKLRSETFQVVPLGMPQGTADYLQRHQLHGNLFNSFDHGGYLAARVTPNIKIYIDGRLDLYDAQTFSDYYSARRDDRGWDGFRYREATTMIVSHYRNDPELSAAFLERRLRSGRWALVYMEENGALLLRTDVPEYAPIIARDRYQLLLPTHDLRYLQSLVQDRKRFKQALLEAERLRDAEPNFILPHLILGRLREYHPEPIVKAAACPHYEAALHLQPQDPQLKLLLAACYGDRGEVTRALNYFRELAEIPAMRSKALLNIGLCYAKMGVFDQARKLWLQLLEEFPDNRDAKHYLMLLDRAN